MSIIMPSGNKSVQDWTSETENGVIKTASTGTAPKDFRTTLYEAAKKSVEDAAKRVKKQAQACECANAPVQETEAMPTTDMGGSLSEVAPVAEEEAVDVTVDDKGEISDVSPSAALDKAKAALTDAMTAIDEAQASVGGGEGEVGEVSVDIPVEEETVEKEVAEEGEKPFDFDKPEEHEKNESKEEEEKEEDIVVESKKEKKENPFAKKDDKKEECKDGEKDEKKENPFAKKETCASVDGYYKLSMVSKKTRDEVYDYYKNKVGLPEDFCKLLVTNYEK